MTSGDLVESPAERGAEDWGKRPPPSAEHAFLEGPHNRPLELLWVLRIAREFLHCIRQLHFVGPCVTVFGSARYAEGHPAYALTRRMGASLARAGFTVMTGGGPGLMEAANRGALEAGGVSIGLNIALPRPQRPNRYLSPGLCLVFRYFALRKLHFLLRARALVAFPGGFGTFDELFEAMTLVQTQKVTSFPIALIGVDYWSGLLDWMRDTVLADGKIKQRDLDMLVLTDDVEEAVGLMVEARNRDDAEPARRPE